MNNLPQKKRVLICTFVALASGFFGSYIGGQISLKAHSHNCQTQPWGLKVVCNAWVAPRAIWQGSTTGLWMGSVLGAFVSGLATRKTFAEKEASAGQALRQDVSLCADDLELSPAQREALRSFLVLLMVKLGTSSETAPESEAKTLSLEELQRLAAVAGLNPLVKQELTLDEARHLLINLGVLDGTRS